jgi:FHS family L-fucose permease-like MFS transporter
LDKGGIACLFLTFFFEGVCYPVIFAVATENLGQYNKLGSGLIAAAVCGGAVWPAMTGAVADAFSTQRAMLIIFVSILSLGSHPCPFWGGAKLTRRWAMFPWLRMGVACGSPTATLASAN